MVTCMCRRKSEVHEGAREDGGKQEMMMGRKDMCFIFPDMQKRVCLCIHMYLCARIPAEGGGYMRGQRHQ